MARLVSCVFFFRSLSDSKLLEIPKNAFQEFDDSYGAYHFSQLAGLTIASSTVNGTREF